MRKTKMFKSEIANLLNTCLVDGKIMMKKDLPLDIRKTVDEEAGVVVAEILLGIKNATPKKVSAVYRQKANYDAVFATTVAKEEKEPVSLTRSWKDKETGVVHFVPTELENVEKGFFTYQSKERVYCPWLIKDPVTKEWIALSLIDAIKYCAKNLVRNKYRKTMHDLDVFNFLLDGRGSHMFKTTGKSRTQTVAQPIVFIGERQLTHTAKRLWNKMVTPIYEEGMTPQEKLEFLSKIGCIDQVTTGDGHSLMDMALLKEAFDIKDSRVVCNSNDQLGLHWSVLSWLSGKGDGTRVSWSLFWEQEDDIFKQNSMQTKVNYPGGVTRTTCMPMFMVPKELEKELGIDLTGDNYILCGVDEQDYLAKADLGSKTKGEAVQEQSLNKHFDVKIKSGCLKDKIGTKFLLSVDYTGKTSYPNILARSGHCYAGMNNIVSGGYTLNEKDMLENSQEVIDRCGFNPDHTVEVNGKIYQLKVLLVDVFEQKDKRSDTVTPNAYHGCYDMMSVLLMKMLLNKEAWKEYVGDIAYDAYARYQQFCYVENVFYGFMNKAQAIEDGAVECITALDVNGNVLNGSDDGIIFNWKDASKAGTNVLTLEQISKLQSYERYNKLVKLDDNGKLNKKIYEFILKYFINMDGIATTKDERKSIDWLNNYRFIKIDDNCYIKINQRKNSTSIITFELGSIFRAIWRLNKDITWFEKDGSYTKKQTIEEFKRMLSSQEEHDNYEEFEDTDDEVIKEKNSAKLNWRNSISRVVHTIVNIRGKSHQQLMNINKWSTIQDSYNLIVVVGAGLAIDECNLCPEFVALDGTEATEAFVAKFPNTLDAGMMLKVKGHTAKKGTIEVNADLIHLIKFVMDMDGDTMLCTPDIRNWMRSLTVARLTLGSIPVIDYTGYKTDIINKGKKEYEKAIETLRYYDRHFDNIKDAAEFCKIQHMIGKVSFILLKENVGKITAIVRDLVEGILTHHAELTEEQINNIRLEILDLLERKTLKLKHQLMLEGVVSLSDIWSALNTLDQFELCNWYWDPKTTTMDQVIELIEVSLQ